jgi:acyl-CoA synthetase (NDP forming)
MITTNPDPRLDERPVRSLFWPRSIAVVGASDDPTKWGHGMARNALASSVQSVYLVNHRQATVAGRPAFARLADVPEQVDLVVLAIPEALFPAAVEDALDIGARALVGITAGFGERSAEGRQREVEVVERVREAGAVLLGPNCAGLGNSEVGLNLFWGNAFAAGPVALLSQSGNVIGDVGRRLGQVGLGYSQFASLGNQTDLSAASLLDVASTSESTRVVALYVEDFRDGRALIDRMRTARSRGVDVVVLAAGRSSAGARSASSHTGSMVSDAAVVDAACAEAGVYRVASIDELVDIVTALCGPSRAEGRRFAVFGDGGGHCTIAADALEAAHARVPRLSDGLAAAIGNLLDPISSSSNPIDTAGATDRDPMVWSGVADLLAASGEVDGLLLTGGFGIYSSVLPVLGDVEAAAADGLVRLASTGGWPVVVHSYFADSPSANRLRAGGIPVYDRLTAAVGGLLALSRNEHEPLSTGDDPGHMVATLGVSDSPPVDYWSARELAQAAGVPMIEGELVDCEDEAVAASERLGWPVVAKIVTVAHKSDVGGVHLRLRSTAEVAESYRALVRIGSSPSIVIERETNLADSIEMIVSVRRDPRFGPIVVVGVGGVHAELLNDTAVGLGPLDHQAAVRLLGNLKGSALLRGARRRPVADIDALARVMVSMLAWLEERDDIAELEINPLLVGPRGAVALDALVVRTAG